MYLNLYVPILQAPAGCAHFWIRHRGHRLASSALMEPMTRRFVAAIEDFAKRDCYALASPWRMVESRSARSGAMRYVA